jgi:hypothetical protein
MGTGTVPPSVAEALSAMETLAGFVADVGAAEMPAEELAGHITATERVSAVLAAALGRLLAAFDAKDGHLTDGQRTLGAWAVNPTRTWTAACPWTPRSRGPGCCAGT